MTHPAVTRHTTSSGIRIYRIPVEVFPKFWGNVYLVLADGLTILVDSGSGLGNSNADLLDGFEQIHERWDEPVALADLQRIILTHGHIDHFGGVHLLRKHTAAPITMHAIDRRVLTNYEGRRVLASQSLSSFLLRAGVDVEQHTALMQMYGWSKDLFRALPVEHIVEDGDWIDDCMQVIHTPGHCPGQICLRIENVLLTADHVLARTSPHLAPETITPGTGLEHYYAALRTIARLDGIDLALGGHEDPIADLHGRISGLQASHDRKLTKILDQLRQQPQTVAELSARIYTNLSGYDVLLALEEIGAHVEYLYLRGHIQVNNIDETQDMLRKPWCYEVF